MRRIVLIFIGIFILSLIGYKYYFDIYLKSYSIYDVQFNRYRNEMKIPVIELDWVDQDPRESIWSDTNFVHIGKHIIFEENNISLEIDRFKQKSNKVLFVYSRYDRNSLEFISQQCKIVEAVVKETQCDCKDFESLWK
jgi:hypothetical protein